LILPKEKIYPINYKMIKVKNQYQKRLAHRSVKIITFNPNHYKKNVGSHIIIARKCEKET